MTTGTSNRCRCRPLLAEVALLVTALGGISNTARAGTLPDDGRLSVIAEQGEGVMIAGTQELYLQVVLNGADTGTLARFVLHDGKLSASADTLRQLGLRWPGSDAAKGMLMLDSLPGTQAVYHVATQRLELSVPVALLDRPPERIGFSQPAPPQIDPASRAPGLILNYDLFAQHGQGFSTLSATTELRLFGLGRGVWSNTMLTHRASDQAMQQGRNGNVRLDTWWQLDLPGSMHSLTVGDTITGALPWTRATRIGGIRFARNFSLQPYRVTTPLASFAGEAVLPSTVDLYINGMRQSTQDVQPGQFQIDSVPGINGSGEAQVVITDINGQSRVVGFSMYGASDLLQAGLSDWSLELGLVRRDYGIRSWGYADTPMASATGRRGISNHFTLEGHAELRGSFHQAGVGGNWLLGQRGGILNASLAYSGGGGGPGGHQYGAGYQWATQRFSVRFDTLRRSSDYRDVASLEGALMPLRTDRAFAGISTARGHFGLGYVAQWMPAAEPSRFLNFNWSRVLPGNGNLSLSANRDLVHGTSNVFLVWSMPLEHGTTVSASARSNGHGNSLSVEANHMQSADRGGWGWRAQATVGDTRNGQVQISKLGDHGQWQLGVTRFQGQGGPGSTTVYAGASGGLVLMQGHAYAMRRVDEAFALVSTSGIAGIPIKLENRLVGTSDASGLFLLSRLRPWQNNQIAIDPMQLPADIALGRVSLDAVPEGRSGMLVKFDLRYTLTLELSLRTTDGQWIPAGSPVWMAPPGTTGVDPAPLTVTGFDGKVYLTNPPAGARLRVGLGAQSCQVTLPAPAAKRGYENLGALICQ